VPHFRNERRVHHRAEQMFDLVADIEEYPHFVPLCQATSNKRRIEDGQGRTVLTSEMTIGYKAIRERFTSRVTLDRPKLKILVEYVDGPFSHLENVWTFKPEGEEPSSPDCKVEFFIDYTFKNLMLAALMGAMFDTAFRKFADAFVARADEIYGARPALKV
jgi:coenzyme Q-binding protein COQ10